MTAALDVRTRTLVPGLTLSVGAVAVSLLVHQLLPGVGTLLVAIVLGVVLANVVPLPEAVRPGLAFAAKRLLRLGVVLLGLQLLLSDVLGLGLGMLVVVVAIVAVGIGATLLAAKALGLSPTQGLLIACGFSICGAAAVAAVDGVIEADEEEVVTAVALVVVFGTLMILVVPLLAGVFGLSDEVGGLWAGGAIHEVAQVVAAGGAIGGAALGFAVVVKLARVMMLAPVLAVVSWQQRRVAERVRGGRSPSPAGAAVRGRFRRRGAGALDRSGACRGAGGSPRWRRPACWPPPCSPWGAACGWRR